MSDPTPTPDTAPSPDFWLCVIEYGRKPPKGKRRRSGLDVRGPFYTEAEAVRRAAQYSKSWGKPVHLVPVHLSAGGRS